MINVNKHLTSNQHIQSECWGGGIKAIYGFGNKMLHKYKLKSRNAQTLVVCCDLYLYQDILVCIL